MQNKKLQALYVSDILKRNVKSESPQTLPAPTKPSTKPTTTPGTPSIKPRPNDPFFPKPNQNPRPKALKKVEEEGENVKQNTEKVSNPAQAKNPSLERFLAKRTQYKQ